MTMHDRIITLCMRELVETNGCHTIILYGSMATGDFNEKSDFDMAGFRKEGGRYGWPAWRRGPGSISSSFPTNYSGSLLPNSGDRSGRARCRFR